MGPRKDGNKRTLVRWSDDLDKQLLLSIQYACNEAGLRIPWDAVAKLMGEKFSDGAIVQHMSKLRQKMVENNVPVPPPLKRGTTAVPSKIYASSSVARRKSMPEAALGSFVGVTAPKQKLAAGRKRGRRAGVESDSDSQPDDNEMDIADTSDDEYSASSRKKKQKQQPRRQAKGKAAKEKAAQEAMEVDDDNDEAQIKVEKAKARDASGGPHNDQVVQETIRASIETPGPAARTRGKRPDYSKLGQISDDEGEEGNDEHVKEESDENISNEDEEGLDESDEPKMKSDGEVSPLSQVPNSPAVPAAPFEMMDLPALNNPLQPAINVGGSAPLIGGSQSAFSPAPAMAFNPRSNMTSFSTNRNDFTGSLGSSMPPGLSNQSSFSHGHTVLGQAPFASQDFFTQSAFDFPAFGGFGPETGHGESMDQARNEDDVDYYSFFGLNHQG